jgi:flavorubredoxin
MNQITEIAPDVYRISTFVPEGNLQFNQFLVRDEEPLLFHTGMKGLFPAVKDAVATLLPPATIRWIGFSHFEADECGSLAEWQTLAPSATAICSFVAKVVSVDDVVARRPAQALADGEQLLTGKYRFRFLQTPHVPHCWEASLLFEETHGTLFCSDLFHQTERGCRAQHEQGCGRPVQADAHRISARTLRQLYAVYAQHRFDAAATGGAQAQNLGGHARLGVRRRW